MLLKYQINSLVQTQMWMLKKIIIEMSVFFFLIYFEQCNDCFMFNPYDERYFIIIIKTIVMIVL